LDFNEYDVTVKQLILDDPPGWMKRFQIAPLGRVTEVDSGITTLTAFADKVFRVGGRKPYLINFEFQSSHETDLVRTLWFRQVALDHRHNLPVHTVLILLRKEANSPRLTGLYQRDMPDGRPTNRYHYQVVRLWKEDPEPYLTASVSLVPLAALTAVKERDLPGLVRRMKDRIDEEPRSRAAMLRTASGLLMGLRYSDDLIVQLLGGEQSMKESTMYQRILKEGHKEGIQEGLSVGEIREARRFLLVVATERFGEPDTEILTALGAIQSVERLESLGRRMIADPTIARWEDLLR
jgi:predicted transposase YdaD